MYIMNIFKSNGDHIEVKRQPTNQAMQNRTKEQPSMDIQLNTQYD